MKRLNLCIDIDGTVTEPYYWIEKANEYFGTSIKASDVICYDIHKILGVEDKDYIEFYKKFGKTIHRESDMRHGASEVINRLYNNHFIHFVTARDVGMRQTSIEWLDKFNIPIDSISLLGSHDKVNKAKELKSDIFIEDRYENAVQLSEAGFDVILIDCNYNKGILHDKVHRVKNWYQIEKIISDRSREAQKKKIASS